MWYHWWYEGRGGAAFRRKEERCYMKNTYEEWTTLSLLTPLDSILFLIV